MNGAHDSDRDDDLLDEHLLSEQPYVASDHAEHIQTFLDHLQTWLHHKAAGDTGQQFTAFPPEAIPYPVVYIGGRLGLCAFEQRLIAYVLAAYYDDRVFNLYGLLMGSDEGCGLTLKVMALLSGHQPASLHLTYGHLMGEYSPLRRMRLLDVQEGQFWPSDVLLDMLVGRSTLDPTLGLWAHHWSWPLERPILDRRVCEELEALAGLWSSQSLPGPLTWLIGPSGSGRTLIASQLSRGAGLGLLKVDVDSLPDGFDLRLFEREALWLGAALLFRVGGQVGLERLATQADELSQGQVPFLVSLERDPGDKLIVGSRSIAQLHLQAPERPIRERLWAHYLPQHVREPSLSDEVLAFHFRGTGAHIHNLARVALDRAQQSGQRQPQVSLGMLMSLNQQQRGRLSGLGQFIAPLPGGIAQVILPQQQLEELRDVMRSARVAAQVNTEWGFGGHRRHGAGARVVLMSGPPGTGKTLSARAMAWELDVPLLRIDLSRMVSKYIGETQKHLAAVFDDAENSGAALLFDEADALFAKRTGVSSSNDRHANMEVGYLLQRIESYEGVCFLTTNLDTSIDPAFERRITNHIRYDLPELDVRVRLWRSSVPATAPLSPGVDFEVLAKKYDQVTGADIDQATRKAASLACWSGLPIDRHMLEHALTTILASRGVLVQRVTRSPTWSQPSEQWSDAIVPKGSEGR